MNQQDRFFAEAARREANGEFKHAVSSAYRYGWWQALILTLLTGGVLLIPFIITAVFNMASDDLNKKEYGRGVVRGTVWGIICGAIIIACFAARWT